jgi:hypothetical protein
MRRARIDFARPALVAGLLFSAVAIIALGACGREEPASEPSETTPAPVATAPTSPPPPAQAREPAHAAAATGRETSCERGSDEDWAHAEPPQGVAYLISKEGLGPVRLGMTLEEARKSLPASFRLERGQDGDGMAWVDVRVGKHALMSLYAGEGDVDAPIDWSARVEGIQSFSKATATAEGVHVGDALADVEKAYGPVRRIFESEIESRQFVEFERQPGVDFRIDYSGDFPPASRETTRYCPGARIYSIATWLEYD